MKSYTNLKQSKKLAEILPIESADLWWNETKNYPEFIKTYHEYLSVSIPPIPCWSLAALISVLPKEVEIDGQRYAPCLFPIQDKWLLKLWYNSNHTITSPIAIFSDNLIDACVAMIEKLKKLNLL